MEFEVGNQVVKTKAMIDCGATKNFINQKAVRKWGLPSKKQKTPESLVLANGQIVEQGLTHEVPGKLIIKNFAHNLALNITNLGSHKIILGMPWLSKVNPQIDWTQ